MGIPKVQRQSKLELVLFHLSDNLCWKISLCMGCALPSNTLAVYSNCNIHLKRFVTTHVVRDIELRCHIIKSIYYLVRKSEMMVKTDLNNVLSLFLVRVFLCDTCNKTYFQSIWQKCTNEIYIGFFFCKLVGANVNKTFECVSLSKKIKHNSNNGAHPLPQNVFKFVFRSTKTVFTRWNLSRNTLIPWHFFE